jgi:hypothetical protein
LLVVKTILTPRSQIAVAYSTSPVLHTPFPTAARSQAIAVIEAGQLKMLETVG